MGGPFAIGLLDVKDKGQLSPLFFGSGVIPIKFVATGSADGVSDQLGIVEGRVFGQKLAGNDGSLLADTNFDGNSTFFLGQAFDVGAVFDPASKNTILQQIIVATIATGIGIGRSIAAGAVGIRRLASRGIVDGFWSGHRLLFGGLVYLYWGIGFIARSHGWGFDVVHRLYWCRLRLWRSGRSRLWFLLLFWVVCWKPLCALVCWH